MRLSRTLSVLTVWAWWLLLLTGCYLWLNQPGVAAGSAFESIENLRSMEETRVWMRRSHWILSGLALVLPIAAALTRPRRPGVKTHRIAAFVGTAIVAAGVLSGRWLPWNQMALWGQIKGTGYSPKFSDSSATFSLGSTEVTEDQLAFVFHLHTKALAVALVLVAFFVLAGSSQQTVPTRVGQDGSDAGGSAA